MMLPMMLITMAVVLLFHLIYLTGDLVYTFISHFIYLLGGLVDIFPN